VLPPNFRDVTAEKVGTVVVIVGATAAGKDKPNRPRTGRASLAHAVFR
jgi:Tfp pilus assembly ATPase PilU